VTLPGHICAVVVTTLVLEGWSNKLDPDHSVLSQVGGCAEACPVNELACMGVYLPLPYWQ
jgi:aarF domain-containing kinase